jgi:peptide/nickel transport system permease protein
VAGAQDFSALVLPAFTLALPIAGVLAQVLREGLEAALAEPFVVTARARGLSQTRCGCGTRCGTPRSRCSP